MDHHSTAQINSAQEDRDMSAVDALQESVSASGGLLDGQVADTESRDTKQSDSESTTAGCTSCTTAYPLYDLFPAECGHDYCVTCLTTLYTLGMNDLGYPPQCCNRPFVFESAITYLPGELAAEFQAKLPELEARNRTYCHVPACSAWIDPAGIVEDAGYRLACPACSALTCEICKEAAHDGDCPQDEATRLLREAMEAHGWKACPGCDQAIELSEGCYHITCPCGFEFCYLCGAVWKTCACRQFDERYIAQEPIDALGDFEGELPVDPFQMGEEAAVAPADDGADVQRLVEIARAAGEAVRQDTRWHGCEHARFRRHRGPHNCGVCGQRMLRFVYQCRECHVLLCLDCRRHRLGEVVEQAAEQAAERAANLQALRLGFVMRQGAILREADAEDRALGGL